MIVNKPPLQNTYHHRSGAGLYAAGGKAGGGDLRTERLLGSSITSSTSTGSSRTTASSCSIRTSTEVVFGNIVEYDVEYGEGVGLATRRVFAGGGMPTVSLGTNWVSMWTWVTVRVAVSISVITAGGISCGKRIKKSASAKTIQELIYGGLVALEPNLVDTSQRETK